MSRNPFKPKPGMLPEVFAGRQTEIEEFKKVLQNLSGGDADPTLIVLYAPRGNGKTALLNYIEKHTVEFCDELDITEPIRIVNAVPAQCELDKLYTTITGKEMPFQRSDMRGGNAGAQFIARAEVKVESTNVYGSPATDYVEVLKRACAEQPALLCIDEAHTMNKDNLRELFQSIQQCMQNQLPISLVLSGTPGILDVIAECKASFTERYDEMTLRTLDDRSARMVFEEPFTSLGMKVPEEYIQEVMRNAQNYPYFLQIYGRAAWEYCIEEGDFANSATLWAKVNSDFEKQKNRMYRRRFDELRKAQIVESAYELAKLYQFEERFLPEELTGYLDEKGVENSDEVLRKLNDLGYVWRPQGDEDFYEQGIPSLTNYVRERKDLQTSRTKILDRARRSSESDDSNQ